MRSISNSVLELVPLAIFFGVNLKWGLLWATGALLVSSVTVLGFIYLRSRKIPKILLFSTCLVVILGGITIITQDETFIKMKPTIVSSALGVLILFATLLGKNPLQYFLHDTIKVSNQGWRALAYCWTVSFFLVAILNELVWRNFDTDTWVNFKVFGITILNLIFAIISALIIMRYKNKE